MSQDVRHSRTTDVTPQGDRELVIERRFAGTPEIVFELMTDPSLIPEWWGPKSETVVVDEMDVRVGGRWRFLSTSTEGTKYAFSGEYREVVPAARIVQTFCCEPIPEFVSLEDGTLSADGDGGTLFRVVVSFDTPEGRDGMIASGMEAGMSETHERFDELLARRQA